MDARFELTRDGVHLAVRDFGGEGPPVVLLHGLAGHAEEWAQTASWLTARCTWTNRMRGARRSAPSSMCSPVERTDARSGPGKRAI